MKTRRFKTTDAPAVSRIMKAAFKTFLGDKWNRLDEKYFSPPMFVAQSNTRSVFSEGASYVAVDGDRIIGYVRVTASAGGLGSLEVVGVDPSAFHKGVGKTLMHASEKFWRRKKQRKVHTCVSAHNTRALTFYISNGFVPVGYRQDHFKVGVDEIILDRFL
ncbi:MAG: GNAT family N-acetyltransferase [Verrucomicrobia bacterium]|nr:GNAT family N-acetyltransferase [Verrucomicrobiota bacterium]